MPSLQDVLANDVLIRWLEPLGRSLRMAGSLVASGGSFSWKAFGQECRWMGLDSVPLVTLAAIMVSLALTLSTVMELQRYGVVDMSGTVITPLLLRELGPLTVSLAWSARVAARLANDAQGVDSGKSDREFARDFLFIRLIAGLACAGPLAMYGLVTGYAAAALFAPTLGVSSMSSFMESSRLVVTDRDVVVYFVKLILINPVLAVFCGSFFGRTATKEDAHIAASRAVTAILIAGYFANAVFSFSVYMP